MIRNTVLYLVFLAFLSGLCFAIYANKKQAGNIAVKAYEHPLPFNEATQVSGVKAQ